MKISGVIFDFNGTLFFDSDKHELAWRQVAKRLSNRELSDEEFKQHLNGRTNSCIIEYIIGDKPDKETVCRLTQEKEELYRDLCKQNIENFKLVSGAIEFLDFLKHNNIPMAIATSSEIVNVKFFIKEFHLDKWFDICNIIYDDGTFNSKPEPDIYLKAARAIGLNPQECVVFEDAISGITAAKRANIGKIIAITKTKNSSQFSKTDGVSQTIQDFNEVDKSMFHLSSK